MEFSNFAIGLTVFVAIIEKKQFFLKDSLSCNKPQCTCDKIHNRMNRSVHVTKYITEWEVFLYAEKN